MMRWFVETRRGRGLTEEVATHRGSVFLPGRGPGARARRAVCQIVVLPRTFDRAPVGGEVPLQLRGAAELRVDSLHVELPVDERPLEGPLPSSLELVLALHDRPRLAEDEDPLAPSRKVGDRPAPRQRFARLGKDAAQRRHLALEARDPFLALLDPAADLLRAIERRGSPPLGLGD